MIALGRKIVQMRVPSASQVKSARYYKNLDGTTPTEKDDVTLVRKIRIRIESFLVWKRTKNFGDELYLRLLLVRHLFDQLHDFGFHFFHRSRSNVDERYEEFEFDAIVEVAGRRWRALRSTLAVRSEAMLPVLHVSSAPSFLWSPTRERSPLHLVVL